MWSGNSSVKSDNYGSENNFQYNKVLNFDLRKLQFERFKIFIGNLYQNMYNNNRNLILQEPEQIYTRFSRSALDCNIFSCIMSSLVNYYLLSCSLRSQRYLSITEKENMFNFNVTFKKSYLPKLSKYLETKPLFCDIPEVILDNSKVKLKELNSCQSIEMYDDNIKVAVVGKTDTSVKLCNLSHDNEFRAFASVLDQDYTKSSKGYSCRKYNSKSRNTDDDNSNSYELCQSVCCGKTSDSCSSCESKQFINKSSFKSLLITSDISFDSKVTYAREDSSNFDDLSVSSSDEDTCDCTDSAYNNVISRYFSALEDNYSISRPYDSDSEDSIIFSEDPCNITAGLTHSDSEGSISFSEDPNDIKAGASHSDSDDSITFSEDPNNVKAELYDSDSEDSIVFCESASNIKNNFIIFCDEDDSNISFIVSNKSDSISSDNKSHENYGLKRYRRSSNICSLSQQELFSSSLQLNFGFQGFENPSFEDDTMSEQYGKLKMVNNNWKILMKDVPEEPRIDKKVSFLPDPELVTVQIFERDEDDDTSSYILDRIRFETFIKEFEIIMAPFLTVEHRTNIILRNNAWHV